MVSFHFCTATCYWIVRNIGESTVATTFSRRSQNTSSRASACFSHRYRAFFDRTAVSSKNSSSAKHTWTNSILNPRRSTSPDRCKAKWRSPVVSCARCLTAKSTSCKVPATMPDNFSRHRHKHLQTIPRSFRTEAHESSLRVINDDHMLQGTQFM